MGDAPTSAATEVTKEPVSTSNEQEKKEPIITSNAPDKSEEKDSEDAASTEQKMSQTDSKQVETIASSVPTTSKEDTDIKDVQAGGASTEEVAKTVPETVEKSAVNGSDASPATPATTKKTNGNPSTKKKSAGVPEHKSRKLNKKKSKPELHLDCQPGDLYLARMKGHSAWPSIIADEDILPPPIVKSRPVTAAQPDGSFKRPDYGPGGKRQNERTYPVMFLHTNEFAWVPNVDLTPLKAEDCVDVETKGKGKALLAAFAIAAEGHELQYFKDMVADHQAAVQEEADRVAELKAEKEAAKAAKAEAKKARRKSAPAADDDEEDAMDVDDDGETQKPKSKKRKKAADAEDDAEEKPAKAIKLKLNGPKTPASEKKTGPKQKASTKKATKKDSDEDMEEAPVAEATLSPAELKEKKEKEIRYYRHKLQKGLLSREDTPSDDEIATASNWLGKLETYPGLEGEIIRGTKIHKVLRAILRLPSIPKDEVYNIKKRSTDLLSKWNSILGEGGADAGHEATSDKNGTATTEKKDDSSAEAKPESAAEDKKEETSEEQTTPPQSETKVNGTSATPAPENNIEQAKPAEPSQEQSAKDAAPEAEKPAQAASEKSEDKPAVSTE